MIYFLALIIFNYSVHAQFTLPPNFIFGVANAPAQVEDELHDIWIDWSLEGNIRSWNKIEAPEKRLQFWTKPEIELDLAKDLGVGSFRMGVDWGRVMPSKNTFDENAIKKYKEILKMGKSRNMKIMLTLMHHSVPKWVQKQGGWLNDETKKDFLIFSKRMISELNDEVEWWITFNEGNVFVTMAYTIGIWPPGAKGSPLSMFPLHPFRGESIRAMDRMAEVHNEIYDWAHKKYPNIKIGLAHNMANYKGKNFLNRLKASIIDHVMNWRFPQKISGKMDFFGFNYYGAEWIKGSQVDIDPEEEYSEAGRAIDVDGLYELLKEIHLKFKNVPIIITENGIADAKDAIRPSYLIEHLVAIHKAIKEKVPVSGYYVWSLTDNLEWSDGYCPKFGLVRVDRKTMKRIPRMSFDVMKTIIKNNRITKELRDMAWDQVRSYHGKDRPFCRDQDGITAFDVPKIRKYSTKDWRFKL